MSKHKLYCCPHLNEKMKKEMGLEISEPVFTYKDENVEYFLKFERKNEYDGGNGRISDVRKLWDHNFYDTFLELEYVINSPECLFGERGVAAHDGEIGLAILYTSSDSKQRGSFKVGSFKADDSFPVKFNKKITIPKGRFRGKVNFISILYIENGGNPGENEKHLADIQGYRLGELNTITVILDEINRWFPIMDVPQEGAPLWSMEYNVEDPECDMFADSFAIHINTKHENYKFVDPKSSKFCIQLLNEIAASALSQAITEFRKDGNFTDGNREYMEGSVAYVLNYFCKTFRCGDLEGADLSKAIRGYLEERIK